ncbi:MAG: BsuPI-related putative proteinase inhibitor [bacterium]
MRKTAVAFVAFALASSAWAIEIDRTRQTVPEKFVNPVGKRFSLFSGDPERVQRANEVKVDDLKARLKIKPAECSLAHLQSTADAAPLEIALVIQNENKRPYTLSFPDAQRYDVAIQDPEGNIIYVWSDDKTFVQEAGKSFINGREKLTFKIDPPISVAALLPKLRPGVFKIQAVLSNYPEVKAEALWTLKP